MVDAPHRLRPRDFPRFPHAVANKGSMAKGFLPPQAKTTKNNGKQTPQKLGHPRWVALQLCWAQFHTSACIVASTILPYWGLILQVAATSLQLCCTRFGLAWLSWNGLGWTGLGWAHFGWTGSLPAGAAIQHTSVLCSAAFLSAPCPIAASQRKWEKVDGRGGGQNLQG